MCSTAGGTNRLCLKTMVKTQHKGGKRKREGEDLDLDVKEARIFECPICLDTLSRPIYQCFRGHLICEICEKKHLKCPTCESSMSRKVRNLAMEELVEKVPMECPNSIEGCENRCRAAEMKDHLDKRCAYVVKNICNLVGLSCDVRIKFVHFGVHLGMHDISVVNGSKVLIKQALPDLQGTVPTKEFIDRMNYGPICVMAYGAAFFVMTMVDRESSLLSWAVKCVGAGSLDDFYFKMSLHSSSGTEDQKYPVAAIRGKVVDASEPDHGVGAHQLTVPIGKLLKSFRNNSSAPKKLLLLFSIKKWDKSFAPIDFEEAFPTVPLSPVAAPKTPKPTTPVVRLTRASSVASTPRSSRSSTKGLRKH